MSSGTSRPRIDICARYDNPLELIFKGISTVGGKPQRLWEWADVAMGLVQRSA